MPFCQSDEVRYYAFDLMEQAGITQAAFTRRGGHSPAPWQSLNLGGSVGDEVARVQANRRRAFETAGRAYESVYDAWQVHGADVVCAQTTRTPGVEPARADAILTDRPEVTLLMRFADCVPILLYDPRRRVVGLVHAGWQGTVRRVVMAAVQAMKARYYSQPQDILAGIGPSIGPDHYEVGADVASQVHQSFGSDARSLLPMHKGAVHFDLWSANRLLLENAGVRHVQTAAICTACPLDDWFSHRAERGKTGRFGVLIGLQPERGQG